MFYFLWFDEKCSFLRGAFSYVKRVIQKAGKTEYAAKFISARAKRKASTLRELNILSHLDHERILYFHDAFEKKNAVIIITELYPLTSLRALSLIKWSEVLFWTLWHSKFVMMNYHLVVPCCESDVQMNSALRRWELLQMLV